MLECKLVQGKCMLPLISPGDMVLYEALARNECIRAGHVYVYKRGTACLVHRARFHVWVPLLGRVTAFAGDRSLHLDFTLRKQMLGIARYCVHNGHVVAIVHREREHSVLRLLFRHIKGIWLIIRMQRFGRQTPQ